MCTGQEISAGVQATVLYNRRRGYTLNIIRKSEPAAGVATLRADRSRGRRIPNGPIKASGWSAMIGDAIPSRFMAQASRVATLTSPRIAVLSNLVVSARFNTRRDIILTLVARWVSIVFLFEAGPA